MPATPKASPGSPSPVRIGADPFGADSAPGGSQGLLADRALACRRRVVPVALGLPVAIQLAAILINPLFGSPALHGAISAGPGYRPDGAVVCGVQRAPGEEPAGAVSRCRAALALSGADCEPHPRRRLGSSHIRFCWSATSQSTERSMVLAASCSPGSIRTPAAACSSRSSCICPQNSVRYPARSRRAGSYQQQWIAVAIWASLAILAFAGTAAWKPTHQRRATGRLPAAESCWPARSARLHH